MLSVSNEKVITSIYRRLFKLDTTSNADAIKSMIEEKKDANAAVVSVLPCPRESKSYEFMPITGNLDIQSDFYMRRARYVQRKAGDVSFLDLDHVLVPTICTRDGIYLNAEGDARLSGRVSTYNKEMVREL